MLALLLCVLAAPAQAGDDENTLTIYGNLTATTVKSLIAVGPQWEHAPVPKDIRTAQKSTWRSGYFVRLLAKLPVTADDPTQAQIDGSSTTWRASLEANYTLDHVDLSAKSNEIVVLGATVDWGISPFDYFASPTAATSTTVLGNSLDVDLHARYFNAPVGGGRQIAPQLLLRYARDYKAAPTTGAVVMGTVKNVVLSAPTVNPTLSLRFAMPVYDPASLAPAAQAADLPLAFAPSIAYGISGADGALLGADSGRLRGELFVYWFPVGQKGGGRIGVAPFLDVRTHGTDDRAPVEYGGLLQLRLGANLLEY